jgi:hypothetical protein
MQGLLMFDITQFRADILTPTLEALQFREIELKELLVFTCAVESAGGTYVKQVKGPALGIFQLEPNTFTDVSFSTFGMTYDKIDSKYTDYWKDTIYEQGFFQNLTQEYNPNINSGILPPAIKYNAPGLVVFERPPCYQMIQYTPYPMDQIEEDSETLCYRVALPWQLYIIQYDPNKFYCNSVRMFFMNSSLTSPEQTLYMPPVPNFFTSGLLCRPMYDSMEDVDRYPKDLSGVIASAYDWIWNSGFNHDLTENFYYVQRMNAPSQLLETINRLSPSSVSGYYRGIGPNHLRAILGDWEKIDISNILNLNWPNPSLNQNFENDSTFYFESDQERFELDIEDYEFFCDEIPPVREIQQTYRHVIKYILENDFVDNSSNFDKAVTNAFLKIN